MHNEVARSVVSSVYRRPRLLIVWQSMITGAPRKAEIQMAENQKAEIDRPKNQKAENRKADSWKAENRRPEKLKGQKIKWQNNYNIPL